jgi:RNA-directed DNA polymerase
MRSMVLLRHAEKSAHQGVSPPEGTLWVDAYPRPSGFAIVQIVFLSRGAMKREGWYQKKSYSHFDLPLTFDVARSYVSNSDNVARHSFFPFISFEIKQRRYKVELGKARIRRKIRPLAYASHLDGYVFAYYAKILSNLYESYIASRGIYNCVIAYRKCIGSNISFAKNIFDTIESRKNCVVICLDIENFFGSIDHEVLKKNWCSVLGVKRLPKDHFCVFRAITRYAWVDRHSCYSRLGIVKPKEAPKPLCSAADFRNLIRGAKGGLKLINTNNNNFGIPQGSQISAFLSNLYMVDFDEGMNRLASQIGGFYFRYSDDIIFVCENKFESMVQDEAERLLSVLGAQIRINRSKTEVSHFSYIGGKLTCDNPVQYLGFTFDGSRRLIRAQTLSKFWRKVVYQTRAAKRRAKEESDKAGMKIPAYKRKIYRKFTHLGKRNFITYASRAEVTIGGGAIKRQIRRHWERVHKELAKPLS